MSDIFKVAAVQMDCVLADVQANLRLAEKLIRQAAAQGAQLVVVPELFATGYRVEEQDVALAETVPGATTDWLAGLCRELQIHLVGALIEKAAPNGQEQLFDTAVLVGPDGLVGRYRKACLWGTENQRFAKGEAQYDAVFDIGPCKVGLQICYEVGFPEPARIMALHGADIVVYTAAFGLARLYAWDLASRARALENGFYVIAANRAGVEKQETVFAGASRIVGPQGNILAAAAEGEANQVLVAALDLAQVDEQRRAIPYLQDLRRREIAAYYSVN